MQNKILPTAFSIAQLCFFQKSNKILKLWSNNFSVASKTLRFLLPTIFTTVKIIRRPPSNTGGPKQTSMLSRMSFVAAVTTGCYLIVGNYFSVLYPSTANSTYNFTLVIKENVGENLSEPRFEPIRAAKQVRVNIKVRSVLLKWGSATPLRGSAKPFEI